MEFFAHTNVTKVTITGYNMRFKVASDAEADCLTNAAARRKSEISVFCPNSGDTCAVESSAARSAGRMSIKLACALFETDDCMLSDVPAEERASQIVERANDEDSLGYFFDMDVVPLATARPDRS